MFKLKYNCLIIICIILSLIITLPAFAESVAWDPPANGPVTGYIVYYGTSQTNLSESVDVGSVLAYDLNNLPLSESTQYYLSVSAYNSAGEGPQVTPPLAYTPDDTTPPDPPVGLVAVPPTN